jgi:hypothetical protein
LILFVGGADRMVTIRIMIVVITTMVIGVPAVIGAWLAWICYYDAVVNLQAGLGPVMFAGPTREVISEFSWAQLFVAAAILAGAVMSLSGAILCLNSLFSRWPLWGGIVMFYAGLAGFLSQMVIYLFGGPMLMLLGGAVVGAWFATWRISERLRRRKVPESSRRPLDGLRRWDLVPPVVYAVLAVWYLQFVASIFVTSLVEAPFQWLMAFPFVVAAICPLALPFVMIGLALLSYWVWRHVHANRSGLASGWR